MIETSPATENFFHGVDVPTPTFPLYMAVKIGAVPVALLIESTDRFCEPLVVAEKAEKPLTLRPLPAFRLPHA